MKERYLLRRINDKVPVEDIQRIFDEVSVNGWKFKSVLTFSEFDEVELMQTDYSVYIFYQEEYEE